MENFRIELLTKMSGILNDEQIQALDGALAILLTKYKVELDKQEIIPYDDSNYKILGTYIATLRLEGKSEKTIEQYGMAVRMFFEKMCKPIKNITTNDIRFYLSDYKEKRKVGKSTIDNIRRFLSAFFAWCTNEEYIDKNPMLRIKKVKQDIVDRKAFSDIELEKIREVANGNVRDRALVEFLLSTGCRISEAMGLNRNDIDMINMECVVFGKGSKERKVYISESCMYHLQKYLMSRDDECEALFINSRGNRMRKNTAECIIRDIGKEAGVMNVHPHRMRRSFATKAVKRGMSLQEVQVLLGHSRLDSVLIYTGIDKELLKDSFKRVS